MARAMTESNDFILYLSMSLSRSEKPRRINPGRGRDYNLDRNGADDGSGASDATDIHPHDDSSRSGRRRNRKICVAGIRG